MMLLHEFLLRCCDCRDIAASDTDIVTVVIWLQDRLIFRPVGYVRVISVYAPSSQ